MKKVIKLAEKPKINRENLVKLGNALYTCEEVQSVSIDVSFKDNSKLSYESEEEFDLSDFDIDDD
jgi:hypothetical protein